MQYRTGNAEVRKPVTIKCNCESMIYSALPVNMLVNGKERKLDISSKNIKPTPEFLVFLPRLVVKSIFSLSKARGLPTFTNITAETNSTRAKITPSGCGTMYPSARLIKNSRKNKTLNKLSLFNLALMKLRIVASHIVLLIITVKSCLLNTYYSIYCLV